MAFVRADGRATPDRVGARPYQRIGAGMQQLPYCIPASSLNAG